MHNSESVKENEIRKVPWDFEIQIDDLSQTTRPSDSQQTKRELAELWILPSRQTTV